MRPKTRSLLWLAAGITAACVFGWPVDRGEAACNEPPDPEKAPPLYASSIGGVDSPFLLPGRDRLISGNAHFATTDVVTIAYPQPANSTVRATLIVLQSDCNGWVSDQCGATGPVTLCAEVTPTVPPPDDQHLIFKVPAYAGEGGPPPPPTKVVPANQAKVYRTGPARVAVQPAPLPPAKLEVLCWLASSDCTNGSSAGLKACIDDFKSPTGTSYEEVGTLTGLPDFNDFSTLCDNTANPPPPHPCKGGGKHLKFAIDANGDILIPMKWTGILGSLSDPSAECPPSDDVCAKSTVVAATSVPKDQAVSLPISVSDPTALRSFNENGEAFDFPPEFVVDPTPGGEEFVLKGTADKHLSVLRIRGCPHTDPTCTQTPRSFDLAYRMEEGIGPVKLPKTGYCDDNPSKSCTNNGQCSEPGHPVACVRMRGHANAFSMTSPPPDDEGSSTGYLLIAVVLVGLALLWWRSGS